MTHLEEILADNKLIKEMQVGIACGNVYVVKNTVSKKIIRQIRTYLESIGKNSLPNYQSTKIGCPNFHRLCCNDERAYVQGCFHQFSFFPWNQDIFNFFHLFQKGYHLKNRVNNIQEDAYLGRDVENGCIARISFQFYPSGSGYLNKHSDPVNYHQQAVATLAMSKKGRDFKQGGAYFEEKNGNRVLIDDITDPGDLVLFSGTIAHGVEMIDPTEESDWLSFKGRWMMDLSTNKLAGNTAITNAIDLEATTQDG